MSTLAVLPIKSFSEAKHRLSEQLTAGPRRALAEAMFSDVLTALRRSERVEAILVVTVDGNAQRFSTTTATATTRPLGWGSHTRSSMATSACCWCPATARC